MITEVLINQKKSKLRICFVLVLIGFVVSSCCHNEVYYDFKGLKNAEWNTDSVLTFDIDSILVNQDKLYDISVELSYNASYPYRDLWINVSHNLNTDSVQQQELKQVFLADEHGHWLGNGFGSFYQMSLPLKKSIRLDKHKKYIINLHNGMKDDKLKGVERLGIRLSLVE